MGKMKQKSAAQELIAREKAECTFKPKITKSKHAQSYKIIPKTDIWKNLQKGKEQEYRRREIERLTNLSNQMNE